VNKLMNLDQRVIYLILATAVILPMLFDDVKLPITVTKPVQDFYDQVENLPDNSPVFITMDFDPASSPELTPMTLAILKHCFKKGHKVVGMTLWPQGVTLGYENMNLASEQLNHKYGNQVREYRDWVFLGAQPGG